jgi:hypothetical protein
VAVTGKLPGALTTKVVVAALLNTGAEFTVRVAVELVTVPAAGGFVTTHWNTSPFMPAVAVAIVSVAVVAPL